MDGLEAEDHGRDILLGMPQRTRVAHDVANHLHNAVGVHDALLVGLKDGEVEQCRDDIELEPAVLRVEERYQQPHNTNAQLSEPNLVSSRISYSTRLAVLGEEEIVESFFTRRYTIMRAASYAALFTATTWAGSMLLLASASSQQVTPFSRHHFGDEVLEHLLGTNSRLART
jgi:hypothetical protein